MGMATIAARISPDGEEEKWVNMKDANDNVYFVKEGQNAEDVLGSP